MASQSRITAQGQVSVPAEIRRKLGVGPGSLIEWHENDGVVTVRRRGQFTSEQIHAAVFKKKPSKQTLEDLRESIGRYVKAKHARR